MERLRAVLLWLYIRDENYVEMAGERFTSVLRKYPSLSRSIAGIPRREGENGNASSADGRANCDDFPSESDTLLQISSFAKWRFRKSSFSRQLPVLKPDICRSNCFSRGAAEHPLYGTFEGK